MGKDAETWRCSSVTGWSINSSSIEALFYVFYYTRRVNACLWMWSLLQVPWNNYVTIKNLQSIIRKKNLFQIISDTNLVNDMQKRFLSNVSKFFLIKIILCYIILLKNILQYFIFIKISIIGVYKYFYYLYKCLKLFFSKVERNSLLESQIVSKATICTIAIWNLQRKSQIFTVIFFITNGIWQHQIALYSVPFL